MRRLFAVILFFPLVALAAGPTLIKRAGGPNSDELKTVLEMDGKLFFGGAKDLSHGFSRAWLLVADDNGTFLVDATYEDPAGRPAEIIALAGGLPLYAGGNVQAPGATNVFVAQLDAQGSVLSQIELDAPGDQFLGDLIVLQDGGVLVVGTTRVAGSSKGDGWVVKLDAGGAIVWEKVFASVGDDFFFSALETASHDLVLAGQVGIKKNPDGFQGWLLSVDSNGNLLWQHGYDIATSDGFAKVLPTPGGYRALGTAFQLAFFEGSAWILEVDGSGGVIDSRLVDDFEQLGNDTFEDGVATDRGGFIGIGHTDTVRGPSQQLWAVEFNRSGVPTWLRHYGQGEFDIAHGVALAADGDVVLAGRTLGQPGIDEGLIVKTRPATSGSASCGGTLTPNVVDFLPTVAVPFLSESIAGAIVVPGNLVQGVSPTVEEVLCP